MELIGSSAQINFFVTNSLLATDSSSIIKLMPLIQEDYMPSYGEEINDDGSKSKVVRLEKQIDSRVFSITFASKSLIVQIDSAKQAISKECFNEIEKIYFILLKVFSGISPKANRLSVVINDGYKYQPEVESKLLSSYFSTKEKPFEWNLKQAFKSEFLGESIFHIVALNRGVALANIHGNVTRADTILFTIDNNTNPENSDFRYTLDNTEFLKALFMKSLSDIDAFLE